MEELMSVLKIFTHNLQVIHRNLTGDGWFADHELIGGYYEELGEMTDDVIEIAMTFGHLEPNLETATNFYPSLSGFKVTNRDAFEHIQRMFTTLLDIFEKSKDGLPVDVTSKFEEYQYWLRKEANYKIAQRLK
jgi:DNA-binding ferritin-like protein